MTLRLFAACVVGGVVALGQVSAQTPAPTRGMYFAPTWEPVAYEMLALAGVTKDDVVYDLGSGDGRIVILAAQKYRARGVGIEIDPRLVAISRQVAREAQVDDRVRFIEGDLFTADISGATVVTLYLSTGMNRDLEPKLRRELKPGTRIVSHQFPIGRWAPDKKIRSSEDGTDLFLWIVPPRDGTTARASRNTTARASRNTTARASRNTTARASRNTTARRDDGSKVVRQFMTLNSLH